MEGGDVRSIAGLCREYVQKKLEAEKTFSLESLLKDPELAQACHMAHFFALVGKERTYILHELKDREFVKWLLDHPEAFEKLAFARASGKDTLAVLRSIWVKEGKELAGVGFNMALGAALASSSREPEECEARYDFYKKSFAEKKLFPQFITLEPWEFGILFQGRESIEELAWAQEYSSRKKTFKAQNAGYAACSFIPYRMKNKQGVSVHAGGAFYDHKPVSLQIYVEYGGVCGAVSKGAAGFVKAKGIPSYTIGQPGHCAFVWKGMDGEWKIGNNIYGWIWSEGGSGGPWKGAVSTITELPRFWKGENASSSNLCYYLSLLAADSRKSEVLLEEALKRNPSNYSAWQALMRKKGRLGEKDKLALLEQFKKAFPGNPTLWEYFVKRELGIDWKKANGYAVYPRLLAENESWDSVDAYMRNFCALARQDIPDMAGKLSYEVKTKRSFFKNWLKFYQQNKVDRKVRVQTCAVLEKALPHLLSREKTALQFLGFYGQVIDLWKDKQLSARADACLTAWLKEADKPSLRKKMAEIGLKAADHLGDKKALVRYAEAQNGY
ncbi:MAG: hypothetical protein ACLS9G_00390 [Akkermansia sp.]